MGVHDPLTEAERRVVELRIQQISNGWEREGEHVRTDWEDRNVESIGRGIWEQRVAGQRGQLEPRIREMADASISSGAPEHPTARARPQSSEDWHRQIANPGEDQFRWFLRNRIAPLYNENPPPRRHRQKAQRVLELHAQGRIGLHSVSGNPLVRGQVEEIARSGIVSQTTRTGERRLIPPQWLLDVLIALAEASTPPGNFAQLSPAQQSRRVPFYVLSLVRLRGNPRSLHYVGRGIDITRYDGHQINMRDPGQAFEGVIGVIRNLPRGHYGLGLPRVPAEGPFNRCVPAAGTYDQTGRWRVGRAGRLFEATCGDLRERTDDYAQFRYFYLGAPAVEPTFRPEYRQSDSRHPWGLINPFLDRRLLEGHSPGNLDRDLQRFEMPIYARRMEQAALLARHSHGAEIRDLFPDKPNHLHLSLLA